MSDHEDRTEAPSAKRLQRARDEGQVPMSREATALAVLSAVALLLGMGASGIGPELAGRLSVFFSQADRLDPVMALRMAAKTVLFTAAPVVLASLVAGAAAILLQTGFLVQLHTAVPDPARLNPTRGLKRIFSMTALLESGKSVVKLAVVGWAGWQAVGTAVPQLQQAMGWDAGTLGERAARHMLGLMLAMLGAQAVIAILDVLYVRLRHMRSLRMSRQELMDEHKDAEGNPQIKRRIKQIRFNRARRRMLRTVPTATVVVTNPTHYAVALAYDRAKGGAPRVVAKGVDSMAARIRELAQDNRVPLVASPPLARALHLVELDAEIPAEHYKAVAEIIAYVWRLRGRALGVAA